MKLIYLCIGKNNNFNLIRIIAALAVLVTHSFALSIGTGDVEPLKKSLDITIGMIAIDVFFITSGFLVTSSLMNRQNIIEFSCARALRIFPALWIMLVITVLFIGPYFSANSLPSYLFDYKTRYYFVKCSTLFTGVSYELPGVFNTNPYNNAVNGSLWTLPWEVRMYTILAVTWIGAACLGRFRDIAFRILIIAYFIISAICVIAIDFGSLSTAYDTQFRLFFMFFTGSAIYILRRIIHLSTSSFCFVIIIVAISTIQKVFFHTIYHLSIAYIVFYLAYVPAGFIRKYNLIGDYSYGIYIYAFPVQQSLAALIPGISVLYMFMSSAAVTILLAGISWHAVEKRTLDLKENFVSQIKSRLAIFVSPLSTGRD